MHAVPVCGEFIRHKKLVATSVKDVPAGTEGECLEACYAEASCEAVSFKTGANGGCWLRKAVTGVADDANKDSYILCEGERGACPPPIHTLHVHTL